MKKIMFKGLAGILTAVLVVLAYLPFSVQAASAVPAVSFVADWYNTTQGTYILITNKGTIGDAVNGHTWTVYEKAVDSDTAQCVLDYTETRTKITDPIYVNTSKFRKNAPVVVTIIVSCADLGYSYTTNLTIKNNENIYGGFSCVTSASGLLYDGKSNNTLDGYKCELGGLARASVNAFMPAGYMSGCEGAIAFNFTRDYKNKQGLVCFNIPEGYQAANRVYKLMTIGQGGVISVLDDVDINPATITANVNFNGFAVVLLYTEGDAIAAPTAPTVGTVPAGSGVSLNQFYNYLTNYSFVEAPQGAQCMNAFAAGTPAGYTAYKTYSLYMNNAADVSPKNGYVTMNVSGGYSDYKLVAVDKNGAVHVFDDIDNVPGTVTFLLNFNGYACQLVAK
ncbi:MAG: hypothetical protein J5476_07615 [Lachnospiraceae bacterium]|nr:hypothetical protein [Lachnospiraceae bacterium]